MLRVTIMGLVGLTDLFHQFNRSGEGNRLVVERVRGASINGQSVVGGSERADAVEALESKAERIDVHLMTARTAGVAGEIFYTLSIRVAGNRIQGRNVVRRRRKVHAENAFSDVHAAQNGVGAGPLAVHGHEAHLRE